VIAKWLMWNAEDCDFMKKKFVSFDIAGVICREEFDPSWKSYNPGIDAALKSQPESLFDPV